MCMYTVASMLLIFPCVRLDCVSSASKTCLDYVWSVNVFMLSVWAILPAQVSLPSLVEVVGLLHNWIRSPSRPLNEDDLYTSLFACPQIWGPGLHFGVLIWVIFWSLFRVPFLGTALGPYNYKQNQGPQNGAKKWNPKQGPKLDPNQAPKCNPGPQICTETQTRSTWSSFSGLLGDRIQLCNKPTTSTKGGRETWAGQNCSNREHEYIHRPNVVKTCFTCRRYTVKSHAGENQQHACYYGGTPMRHRKTACFEALVLEPHFAQSCGRFLLLYCLLGWRTSLQRLKVATHVLVKSWFAAPLPCTFQCFVRKVKNADRKHFVLAPNPAVLLGFCAPSSVVSVASGWWVGDFSLVLGF